MPDVLDTEAVDGVEPSILVEFVDDGTKSGLGAIEFPRVGGDIRILYKGEQKLLTVQELSWAAQTGAELKVIDTSDTPAEPAAAPVVEPSPAASAPSWTSSPTTSLSGTPGQ